jgi:FAD/FMN-containing dehydrogenase
MLKNEIKTFFKGDVEDSSKTLERYSHDYSIFEVKPELVVFPKDAEDIKNLVKFLNKKREEEGYVYLSLTARGAGTDMTGGPLNDSIILDTSRYMGGVLEVKKQKLPGRSGGKQKSPTGHDFEISGMARALPGTYYRDFEKETLKAELIMPCYPASRELATIGGMVANNGAGEKTLKYGQNKDFVKSLKVILDDGEEYVIEPLSRAALEATIYEECIDGRILIKRTCHILDITLGNPVNISLDHHPKLIRFAIRGRDASDRLNYRIPMSIVCSA